MAGCTALALPATSSDCSAIRPLRPCIVESLYRSAFGSGLTLSGQQSNRRNRSRFWLKPCDYPLPCMMVTCRQLGLRQLFERRRIWNRLRPSSDSLDCALARSPWSSNWPLTLSSSCALRRIVRGVQTVEGSSGASAEGVSALLSVYSGDSAPSSDVSVSAWNSSLSRRLTLASVR